MPARRRWFLFLIAIGTLSIGLHGMVWWVVTGQIMAGLPAGLEQFTATGWRVEGEQAERAGWPWRASVRVRGFVANRVAGQIRWSAESLVVSISPLDPARLQLAWGGEQRVTFGAFNIPFHARQMVALSPLEGGPLAIAVRDLMAGPVAVIDGEPARTLMVGSIEGTFLALAGSITLQDVVLRPPLPSPLEGSAALSARVTTNRAWLPMETPARAAAAWRADAGRVEVAELSFVSGPVQVRGQAEGGLDAGLQPRGRALLRVVGASTVLDGAARAGLLGPGPTKGARAVLQLLALGAAGEPVPVTMTLEDRTLTVVQFPLLRVPALEWGAP